MTNLVLSSILLFLFVPFIYSKTSGKVESPNIILIYADDLGYADSSVQMMDADPSTKHSFIKTPGMERLAKIGTRYTSAYSPSPTCTASRMSIQHGQSTAKIQYRYVFDVLSELQRPDGYEAELTLAEMIKESGKNYITAHFGKGCSAMGRFDEAGFDVTDENPGEAGGNGNGHGSYWDPIQEKTPFPPDNPKRMYSLMKDSSDFVYDYCGKQPFFMMVSHYAPHIPYYCTKKAFERNKKRWMDQGLESSGIDNKKSLTHKTITYASMVEEMDMTLVAILDALETKGGLENTYIIFTSDNGGGFAERKMVDGKQMRFNGPLQEGKRSIYEGGIRVPTLIAGPKIESGSECDVPIVQWDFFPTFHDLIGSKAPLSENVDGGSLRSVFENGNLGKVERKAPGIIHHYICHYHPPISSIILGEYKLMRHLNSGEFKLFHLKTDYREENNLASSMPEKVQEMDRICREYVEEVNGGTVEESRQAHHKKMDKFSQQAMELFERKLSLLKDEIPSDFQDQKVELLKQLNKNLFKHQAEKQKSILHRDLYSWRDGPDKKTAEKIARSTWTEYKD